MEQVEIKRSAALFDLTCEMQEMRGKYSASHSQLSLIFARRCLALPEEGTSVHLLQAKSSFKFCPGLQGILAACMQSKGMTHAKFQPTRGTSGREVYNKQLWTESRAGR